MADQKAAAKRTKYKLKKPHTHRGITYGEAGVKDGIEIDLTQEQYTRLNKQGIV